MKIERWPAVTEAEAVAVAGPGASTVRAGDVTYALGTDSVVVIVEAGDRPDGSGVRTAADITVLEPFPDLVAARLTAVPRPTLIAFVRLADAFLALGTVRVSELGHRDGR